MPLTTGTRLANYEIVAPLGSGGMGEVYRAKDLRLGRDVALKVLPADVAAHADRLARFEREARAIAALNHPNIVVLYTVEDAGGTRFLTMECVEGSSLDRHVAPGGLPLAEVLDVGIALSDALSAAHDKGVVHRDLKPANVMLTEDGRVKVLDFGLARLAAAGPEPDATHAATFLSSEGQAVGTVPYMSPEALRGRTADARSDLFALGIVLHELATGHRPFEGATLAEVSCAILRDDPPPLTGVRADLPGDLDRIVRRCLEKDPAGRFQTAREVREELDRVRRAGPSGPAYGDALTVPGFGGRPAIAVLPFDNRSGDPEQEYFADGLAEDLIARLSLWRTFPVIARNSSFSYKGQAVDLK
jgi:serine/threonine protein kinase